MVKHHIGRLQNLLQQRINIQVRQTSVRDVLSLFNAVLELIVGLHNL